MATTGLAASFFVAVPATTASAAPIICERGTSKVDWVTTDRGRKLTHKVKGYEKGYSGGARTITKTLTHTSTVTSGRSVEAGGSAGFSVGKILKSLDVEVSGSFTHQKDNTTTRTVKVKDKLTKKGQYFFYRGTVKATGTWQGYRCDGGTQWIKSSWGKARTFSAEVDGAVRCGERVSKKSLAKYVQKRYC
ncbi:hypothetical protein ACOBQB_34440 [Streptomyces sp. G5(2025)]|uniref:hypothetical protein n=1 Tax=Streptomyces sp. G5(2025) TaxID=3406628 RepID=UPI003C1DB2AC